MNTFLVDYKGTSHKLPVLLSWNFSYGSGTPCDAFQITFIYRKSMLNILTDAVRFKAVYENETVFYGVVDDFEVSISDNGCVVNIYGRGLAALLLDNEAEAAQYYSASLDNVLEQYVFPYGITQVRRNVNPPARSLDIESGASMWKVLENFMWFGSGVKPRFSKDGVLILGKEAGKTFYVGSNTAVSEYSLKRKRYGVISEVIIKNKALGVASVIKNDEFIKKGGCCRRVVNVPRKTRFDTMRTTGEYQISQSKSEELLISVIVPKIFAVFPGDNINLGENPLGLSGDFTVDKTICFADGYSMGTKIIIKSREV